MAPCIPSLTTEQPLSGWSSLPEDERRKAGSDDAQRVMDFPYLAKDSPLITSESSGLGTCEPCTWTTIRPATQRPKVARIGFGTLLRTLLLDTPLMIIFGISMSLFWVNYVHDNYLVRQLQAAEWTEERAASDMSYYTRPCFTSDMSTMTGEDLFLSDDATSEEAYDHQLRHGFTVFPNVLSQETARNLRQHIDSRNRNLTEAESNFVLSGQNRFSYSLGTEEPFVAEAMMELTTNSRLKESVEKIMGKNPALIEMTAITSSYGAVAQDWHDDVVPDGSPVQFARAFGPSYSIFVVLQNTTKSMGATGACPGLHMCAAGPIERMCEEHGFQVVSEHGYWRAGDALLMNMNSWHRGAAHTDPNAPDRVMLILTFVPQPRSHAESRQMSQGITFSLRWDMWGHTWNDLSKAATAMKQPWATLRALGIYKERSADWGIDYVSGSSMRMANEDNGFRPDELIDFVHRDGGFKFIPSWLHGEVGDDEETSWHEFLVDTLNRCKRFMIRASAGAVGAYILFYLLAALVSSRMRGGIKEGMRRFRWALVRLSIMASVVLVLYYVAIKRVDNTQWASDLKQGLRYTSPFGNEESRFHGPTAFPHRNDVLIETRFKSKYLAMYNDYVNNHPGNRVYNELVAEKAPSFASYVGLPAEFRFAIAHFIVGALSNQQGRFLYQNADADFVMISESNAVAYTVQELATNSNTIRKNILQELEFLISEAKYGHLRESTMNKHHILRYLRVFQSRLQFDFSSLPAPPSSTNQDLTPALQPNLRAVTKPTLGEGSKPTRRSVVLNAGKPEESPNEYLQAGKIVEVKYKERRTVRWYKAMIVHVASTGDIRVLYEGAEDLEEVYRLYVREYISPIVGEMVEVEVGDAFEEGMIVRSKGDGLFDVEVDGEILEDVSDATFRRWH